MFTEIKASLIMLIYSGTLSFSCTFSLLYFLLWPVKYTFTRKTSRYDPNYCVTAGLRGSFLFDYEKRSLKQELLGHDKRSNL